METQHLIQYIIAVIIISLLIRNEWKKGTKIKIFSDKAMSSGGIILLILGIVLIFVHLFIGIAIAIIGVIFIVGGTIRNSLVNVHQQSKTGVTKPNIPKQIEQLAKLRDQGILSDIEFEEKKKQLLSRL